jgi:hypothetical protein
VPDATTTFLQVPPYLEADLFLMEEDHTPGVQVLMLRAWNSLSKPATLILSEVPSTKSKHGVVDLGFKHVHRLIL